MADNETGAEQESMSKKQEHTEIEAVTEQETVEEQSEAERLEEAAGASGEDLQARLEDALQQIAHHKDLALRAQAELQNVRRRAERDVKRGHKYELGKVTRWWQPVVDKLESALDAAGEDNYFVKALKEGVELTLSMFLKVLATFKIEAVNPEGEPFDPALHQAVSIVEQNQVEPNTVVNVMQKGYTLHGRIVRPAMVVVSKAAAQGAPKIDEQA